MCDYEMFNHGQTISFGDGQQAIILQSPDQSGAPQSKPLNPNLKFSSKSLLLLITNL